MKLLHTLVKKIPPVLFLSLLLVETSHAEWVDLGNREYQRLCPDKVGGDREYAGHGPEVRARAGLSIVNGAELRLNIYMRQRETKHDWSEALLRRNFFIYRAPPGRRITSIWNDAVSEISYVDTDHGEDEFFPLDTLIEEFRIKGDTGGKDIGNCTADDAYLSLITEPLAVFIE
jgi:hypothetical protein